MKALPNADVFTMVVPSQQNLATGVTLGKLPEYVRPDGRPGLWQLNHCSFDAAIAGAGGIQILMFYPAEGTTLPATILAGSNTMVFTGAIDGNVTIAQDHPHAFSELTSFGIVIPAADISVRGGRSVTLVARGGIAVTVTGIVCEFMRFQE